MCLEFRYWGLGRATFGLLYVKKLTEAFSGHLRASLPRNVARLSDWSFRQSTFVLPQVTKPVRKVVFIPYQT